MKIKREYKPGTWLIRGGMLLIAAALFLTGYNLWDERRAAASAEQVLEELRRDPESSDPDEGQGGIPDYLLNPDMEMPVIEIDGIKYIGTLEIPAFDISLPIAAEWSYEKLRTAPCRYAGSAYKNNLVIAAHNYRAHFGLLKELSAGARVTFTDTDGNVFTYDVTEVQILEPLDIEEMISGEWDLTLFTCTLSGQTRLAVRCEAAEELPGSDRTMSE